MSKVLELVNVQKKFGSGHTEVTALNDSTIAINEGEFVAVIGPSGSGKSTFLTIAAGLQKPTTGEVSIAQKNLMNLSKKELLDLRFKKIGFILQSSNLVPFLKVIDQFKLIEKVDKSKKNPSKREELMKTLGIYDLRNKYPRDLSGGERQRVAIACALYHDPAVILADEPTASLDSERAFEVVELLANEAKAKNKGIVMVTHDERLLSYCDRVIKIRDGQMKEVKPPTKEA
ncbi:ABC transporter ATP-binding protein [Vagococcus sp. BWB3-3]|uniref:Putative hemin import ATP-binding protein HrtA n=1 Tax=Vagococcus allomyrinae TaxID=2794353 RepID=A0A940P4U6_9ENTE|nr:ABC transporter ATP-binding protein [Vagococcus allomyrinae]MBP1039766.1 ABC transporter ATP-binding protein [Vagococcus allomyrinae]